MDQQAFRREQMLASGLLRAPEPPPALVLPPRPLKPAAPVLPGEAKAGSVKAALAKVQPG